MNSVRRKAKVKNALWGYFFIAPTIIGIFILNIWSVIQTIYLSFTETRGFSPSKFIGLDNYKHLFSNPEVFRALGNTFTYALITVPVGVFLSLLVAVLLNSSIRGKGIFRVMYFLPVISAPVAVALVWRWLYNRQYGLINHMLKAIGVTGPDWLGSGKWVLLSICIVGIWSMVGYNMVILLAGLQEIPRALYESAEIDGAGPVRRFFNITVPMVSPTLFFVTVTSTISALQVFDMIFMMIEPSSPSYASAQSIVNLFYRYTFTTYNKGYGSTIIVLLLIIILIITFIQMQVQKKLVHYE